MTGESFLDGKITLHGGDSLEVLKTLPANSVDSVCTDPPYGLGREPDALVMLRAWLEGGHYDVKSKSGFMGKEWDSFVPQPAVWKEVFRVLKPGGHVLAFFGTRTYDLGTLAIRIAGFEVRDLAAWLYGSGFPKSLDVSKALDKRGGYGAAEFARAFPNQSVAKGVEYEREDKGAPVSDDASRWRGWGTALKPALEPICVARKPLISAVAENVLKHGTGALNIDGCRVDAPEGLTSGGAPSGGNNPCFMSKDSDPRTVRGNGHSLGRWPANVIHDGSEEVVGAFPQTTSGLYKPSHSDNGKGGGILGAMNGRERDAETYGDTGSAARFFYTAKADADDRLGSKHPTVKPLDLMQWLVRLVTPPGGTILDPFAGTGTTGEAAFREGFRAILIEREAEYQDDIRRRMKLALAGTDERTREAIKARNKGKPIDHGPLFGGSETAQGGGDASTESSRTNDRPGRIEAVTP